MSKSDLKSVKHLRASQPSLSVNLRIYFSELRSVRIVNRVSSRYSRNKKTVHTIARLFQCVVSYLQSGSVNDLCRYPTGFAVLSGC